MTTQTNQTDQKTGFFSDADTAFGKAARRAADIVFIPMLIILVCAWGFDEGFVPLTTIFWAAIIGVIAMVLGEAALHYIKKEKQYAVDAAVADALAARDADTDTAVLETSESVSESGLILPSK